MKKCTCGCYTESGDRKTRKDFSGVVRGCRNQEDIGTYLRWEPSSAGTLFCCKERKLGGSMTCEFWTLYMVGQFNPEWTDEFHPSWMCWGPGEPSLGGETQVRAPWGPQVESLWLEVVKLLTPVVRKCLESRQASGAGPI